MKTRKTTLADVGIRIRKARGAKGLSQAELGGKVGVSPPYIGMIERGEKYPSAILLSKIAEATDAPPGWLEESLADSQDSLESPQETDFLAPSVADIDIPILMSLLIQAIPGMTGEKIAGMLDIPAEDMDGILSGQEFEPAPHWIDCCSFLAKQVDDIPSLCRKLRAIDRYFQHENAEKKMRRFQASLKRLAGDGYRFCTPPEMKKADGSGLWDADGIYAEHVMLRKGGDDWHFCFCRFSRAIDRYTVQEILDALLSYIDSTGARLTLVLESEDILRLFGDAYGRRQDGASIPPMSLLLVDRDTWEAAGKPVELPERAGVPGAGQKNRRREDAGEKWECLYASLERWAGAGYAFCTSVQEEDGSCGVCAEHIVLRNGGQPSAEDRHFVFCWLPDDDFEEDVVRDFVINQISCDDADALPVFVSDSEKILGIFWDEHDRLEIEDAAMAELAEGHGRPEPLPLSLLLAVHGTWEVIGEF